MRLDPGFGSDFDQTRSFNDSGFVLGEPLGVPDCLTFHERCITEWVGWIGTAVFALSYAATGPVTLRRIQAAAVLWIIYGAAVGAAPVVVANAIVATMALLQPAAD